MMNKKTIKRGRTFGFIAFSRYAKSSRERSWGVIMQFNKKQGRISHENPCEIIIPRITVMPGWISW